MHQSRDNRPVDSPPPPNSTAGRGALPFLSSYLTGTQLSVLSYIARVRAQRGFSPTFAEIAGAFGWHSANSALEHCEALISKGALTRIAGIARSLTPTPQAVEFLGLPSVAGNVQGKNVIALPVYTAATLPRMLA